MLAVGRITIVQRADEGLGRKRRLPLQDLAGMRARRDAVAELGERRGQEGVVRWSGAVSLLKEAIASP